MSDDFYISLIASRLSGNISREESEQLRAWLAASPDNRKLLEEMEAIWDRSGDISPRPVAVSDAWMRLEQRIVASDRPRRLRLRGNGLVLLAAALLLLLVFAFLFRQAVGVPADTPGFVAESSLTEKKELVLPDGSLVVLNAGSRLEFSQTDTERRVQLSGEAFFDVEKEPGRPFFIAFGGTQVRVLGTRFNVRAYEGMPEMEVFVEEGTVSWGKINEAAAPLVLTAGMAGKFDVEAAVIAEIKVSDTNMLSWKSDTLVFADTRMKEVVLALERHYGVVIEVSQPEILNCHFSGTFAAAKITEVLEALTLAMDLRYEEREKGRYLLSGTGCPR